MSRLVTWAEVYERLAQAPAGRLFGIPRGGAIVAGLTGRAVDRLEEADWVVDDVIETGRTLGSRAIAVPVWALFDRERDGIGDRQIVFPWDDQSESRRHKLERLGTDLLDALGYDPTSPHLAETPARWARWWEEFIDFDPGKIDTTFEEVTVGQLVIIGGVRMWSICEHHLLPFHVDVHIGYVPSGRVLGLSKFVRLAQRAAHQLQVQERLTRQVAQMVTRLSGTHDVAVLSRGQHLCMQARGVKTETTAISVAATGRFETDGSLRQDFLLLAGGVPRGRSGHFPEAWQFC